MKDIPVYGGWKAIVDDEDYERLSRFKWYGRKHHPNPNRYAYRYAGFKKMRVNRKVRYRTVFRDMHRDVFSGSGLEIDHINRNTLDNRKCNLRSCTRSQNSINKDKIVKTGSTSAYKGVSRQYAGRYRARIRCNYATHELGAFDTEIEAARAYNEAAKRLFGEFAVLNHIRELEAA